MSQRPDENRPQDDQAGENAASYPPPQPEQEQPVCAVCGKPIDADDLVCPHCGTKLVSG